MHTAIGNIAGTVEIQQGAVVSKVIHRDGSLNVTVFGFDVGEGLTEHTASRTALIEIVRGRLELTVDGETYDAAAGFWLHMAEGAPHALVAKEPTVMLLTMIGG